MDRKSRKGRSHPTEAKANRIGCLSARPRSIHRRYAVSAITPIQTAHRGISAATVIMQPFKTMFRLGRWADVGAGIRYDYRSTHSEDKSVSTGTHRNLSWNAGVVLKPFTWMDLTYRASTGFRLPSFAEMYGWRAGESLKTLDLKPENPLIERQVLYLKGTSAIWKPAISTMLIAT